MATQKCTCCGEEKPLDSFHVNSYRPSGRDRTCKICYNTAQREYRRLNGNADTKRYEKTKRGFLMRLYRNMQSRVTGVQRQKLHLYAGKPLAVTREQFYEWGFTHPSFHELFAAWEISNYARQYTPSVDRIDSARGYELDNMEWVTHSENSRRGSQSRIRQGKHRRNAA
jgi:hypothetical protein